MSGHVRDFRNLSAQIFHLTKNAEVGLVLKCVDATGTMEWGETAASADNGIAEWSTFLVSPLNGPNFDLVPNNFNLFDSIQSALDKASIDVGVPLGDLTGTTSKRILILLRPGVYTENITVPYYVSIKAIGEDCVIDGTVTVNSQVGGAQDVKLDGVKIINGGVVMTETAAANLHLNDCIMESCSIQVNSTSDGANYYSAAQRGTLFMESCEIVAPALNEAITIASAAGAVGTTFNFVYLLNCTVEGLLNYTSESGGYQVIVMNSCKWDGLGATTALGGDSPFLFVNDSAVSNVVIEASAVNGNQVALGNCQLSASVTLNDVNSVHRSCDLKSATVVINNVTFNVSTFMQNCDASSISFTQTAGEVRVENCNLTAVAALTCNTDCKVMFNSTSITCLAPLTLAENAQEVSFSLCDFINVDTDFITLPNTNSELVSFSHCTFVNKSSGGVLVNALDVASATNLRVSHTTFTNCNINVTSAGITLDNCLITSTLASTLFSIAGASGRLISTKIEGSVNTAADCVSLTMSDSSIIVGAVNFFDLLENAASFTAQNCTFNGESFGAPSDSLTPPASCTALLENCTITCATDFSFTCTDTVNLSVSDSRILCGNSFDLMVNDFSVDVALSKCTIETTDFSITGAATPNPGSNHVIIVCKDTSVTCQSMATTNTEGEYTVQLERCDFSVASGNAFQGTSTGNQELAARNTQFSGGATLNLATAQALTVRFDNFKCEGDVAIQSTLAATVSARNSHFIGDFTVTSAAGLNNAYFNNSTFDSNTFSLEATGDSTFAPLSIDSCAFTLQGADVNSTIDILCPAAATAVGSISLNNNLFDTIRPDLLYGVNLDLQGATLQMAGNACKCAFTVKNDEASYIYNNTFNNQGGNGLKSKMRIAVFSATPPGTYRLYNNYIEGQIVVDDSAFVVANGYTYDIMVVKNTVLAGEVDGGDTYADELQKMWLVFQSSIDGSGTNVNRTPEIKSYHNKVLSVPLVDNTDAALVTLTTTNFVTETPKNVITVTDDFSFTVESNTYNDLNLLTVTTDTTVDWGDTNSDTYLAGNTGIKSHTYADGSIRHKITVTGDCVVSLRQPGSSTEVKELVSWGTGDVKIRGVEGFQDNADMILTNVQGAPIFDGNSFSRFFFRNYALTSINNVNLWDTSGITNFFGMFQDCDNFDEDVSGFDMTNAQSCWVMFLACTSFNNGGSPNINDWNITSSCTNLRTMFANCAVFNQPIGGWDVSGVTTFRTMLLQCPAFDQSLADWNITSATDMISFLQGGGLSEANYEATIVSWANQIGTTGVQTGVTVHFGNSPVNGNVNIINAKNALIAEGWSITDGGP